MPVPALRGKATISGRVFVRAEVRSTRGKRVSGRVWRLPTSVLLVLVITGGPGHRTTPASRHATVAGNRSVPMPTEVHCHHPDHEQHPDPVLLQEVDHREILISADCAKLAGVVPLAGTSR